MPLRPPTQADRINEATIKMTAQRNILNSPVLNWNKYNRQITIIRIHWKAASKLIFDINFQRYKWRPDKKQNWPTMQGIKGQGVRARGQIFTYSI